MARESAGSRDPPPSGFFVASVVVVVLKRHFYLDIKTRHPLPLWHCGEVLALGSIFYADANTRVPRS